MVCRAIRNAVMKTNPSWDVDALPYGEFDNDTSRILGEYLAFQYDRLNLEEKVNKSLLYGLLYGLGILVSGSTTSTYALTNPNTWPSGVFVRLVIELGAIVAGEVVIVTGKRWKGI